MAQAKKKRKKKIATGPVATPAHKRRFLEKMSEGNAPAIAARLAGISKPTVYKWKKEDPEFAIAWDDALDTGIDKVETALVKRAIKHSDTAALAFLRAYRPERYGRKEAGDSRSNNLILNITLEEHNKRLERLGLRVPVTESDLEGDDAPIAITHNP